MNNIGFKELLTLRRSIYAIGKQPKISDKDINKLIETAVLNVPSAFNGQGARVIVLYKNNHDRLWQITMDALREVVPQKAFSATEKKINLFAAGYGTVLFFDDTKVVESLQEQFPIYAKNFPTWAQQSNGMLQFAVWTLFAGEGIGASLQHYNELIDAAVKKEWSIEQKWQLVAQMPFGNTLASADEKTFLPIADRVKFI